MGTVLILSRKQRAVAAHCSCLFGESRQLFPGSLGTETAGFKYTINIVSSVRGKEIDGISSQEKAATTMNGGIRNRCFTIYDASAKARQQPAGLCVRSSYSERKQRKEQGAE